MLQVIISYMHSNQPCLHAFDCSPCTNCASYQYHQTDPSAPFHMFVLTFSLSFSHLSLSLSLSFVSFFIFFFFFTFSSYSFLFLCSLYHSSPQQASLGTVPQHTSSKTCRSRLSYLFLWFFIWCIILSTLFSPLLTSTSVLRHCPTAYVVKQVSLESNVLRLYK